MSYRNRTPRMAALILSLALGGASLATLPAADAAVGHADGVHAKAGATPATVVTRLSHPKGSANSWGFIKGTGLATWDDAKEMWVAKAVKFGDTTVDPADVYTLSSTTLEIVVPEGPTGTVTVLVGDAAKGPKFTYIARANDMGDPADITKSPTLTSESGGNVKFVGTNFTKSTKIVVGGKTAKVITDGLAADGKSMTVAFPAGLTDEQDVFLVDGGVATWLTWVKYKAAKVTASTIATQVLVEAPTAVALTGTNLDKVVSATYNGEKVTFAKATDNGTKMVVTVPKGTAVDDKNLVLTTKYGETATITLDRVAAATPTVTAVSTVTASTAGEITLTGTSLTGLKKVVIKSEAGKLFAGSKFVVAADGKSAKVTFPALTAGKYTVSVTAVAATASTEFEFTVAAS